MGSFEEVADAWLERRKRIKALEEELEALKKTEQDSRSGVMAAMKEIYPRKLEVRKVRGEYLFELIGTEDEYKTLGGGVEWMLRIVPLD